MSARSSESSLRELVRHARKLRKAGDAAEALGVLRVAALQHDLEPDSVDRIGRFIVSTIQEAPGEFSPKPLSVRLMGQCTTSWLVNSLAAMAWRDELLLDVREAEFDNIMQDLMALSAAPTGDRPEIIVLLPWSKRLLAATGSIEAELDFWQQAWGVARRAGARIIQVGFDAVSPDPFGVHLGGVPASGGAIDVIRRMNHALREALPEDVYYIDLERIAGDEGRRSFYDPRRYFWTKQPFSETGVVRLGEHLAVAARAMVTGPKKVLVLDLDNTCWGGVVGETGALGVELGESPDGEAYRALQHYAKSLSERGVVLAVCSKNNPDDARGPFEEHPDMVLKLDDIAAFEASWDPKAIAIQRIADQLRLGLDSFVFLDDNPAEREHVRQALPQVSVVEVTGDPSEYVRALSDGLYFEAAALTAADLDRSQQYQAEGQRERLKEGFTLDAYLESLEMVGDVRPIDEADMQRVVQLIGKTNQFNLTTRRHSRADVERLLAVERAVGLTVRIADRFGDHGLIAVLLAVPDPAEPESLRIDSWLMSCRVIGRTAEQFIFNSILQHARRLGFARIVGEYIPTKKNVLVADLYDRLGFERLHRADDKADDKAVTYRRDVNAPEPPETFVTLLGSDGAPQSHGAQTGGADSGE